MSDTSPEQPLDYMQSPRGIGQLARRGAYINRFRFQRDRLRALQTYDDTLPKVHPIKRPIPKLTFPRLERDDTNISSISSKSIETIKLPSVTGDLKVSNSINHKPPVRTLNLKLYPEHLSRMAKSQPSLPSIPGSPVSPQTNISPQVSPDSEAVPETDSESSHYPSQHRFEVIAFQKTIHPEKRDITYNETRTYRNVKFQKHILYHLDESPRKSTRDDEDRKQAVPIVIQSPVKYSRRHRKSHRKVCPRSEGSAEHKKWKDDCGCLRCQIIKRQYKEGDALYKIWGEYPCHHIDPEAVDDD